MAFSLSKRESNRSEEVGGLLKQCIQPAHTRSANYFQKRVNTISDEALQVEGGGRRQGGQDTPGAGGTGGRAVAGEATSSPSSSPDW